MYRNHHTIMATPHYLLFLLVFAFPFHAVSQTKAANTITMGSSLSASEKTTPWFSPSGDFAFGFQKVQDTDQFVLSIWFDKIPDKTIVWFVNHTVEAGSEVQLTDDRGLVLRDSQGKVLWDSLPLSGTATSGVMNDTGNFMVVDSNSFKLWDTFSNPTDTLLPTQIMDIGGVLNSKKGDTDFSNGRFQLRLVDGNLVLNTRDIPTNHAYDSYYTSGTSDKSSPNNSGYQLRFNQTGYLSILRRNGEIFDLTTRVLPSSGYYYRAILHVDGVFVHYSHPKNFSGTPNWDVIWRQPDNICTAISFPIGSGPCGFNSFCSLDDSGHSVCNCPTGYSLVDPDDKYGSCKPNFSQSCDDDNGKSSGEDLYYLEELNNANCPDADYELLSPISESDCRKSCLNDCFCAIVNYGSENKDCYKKRFPFSNGRNISSETGKILLKIKKDLTAQTPKDNPRKKDHRTMLLVGSLLIGSSVFANVIFVSAACLGCFNIYHKKTATPKPFNHVVVTNLRCFTYNELEEATDGFKEELGRGAFGIVYKGVLPMSSTNIVAVKKLDRLVQDKEKEFKTEINVIAQTHHKNLVRLLGFCEDGEHRMLVYEYMANGALSTFLFGDVKPSWAQRSSIAVSIARGLAYLHEECSTQIIHCDIKPQNILLDEYYNARISDFGLAKLLNINQSRTNTAIRGTRGYVAPDWFRNSPVTVKVDVYSFGVLLLEIICCRKSVEDMELGGEKDILIDWAWDCFQEGKLDSLVENQEDVLNDWSQFETFVMVAIWCIQEDASLRPTMRKVIQMLEGVVDVPKPPCPSLYS